MKSALLLVGSLALFVGCAAPVTTLRLQPLADETRFTDGLQATRQERDGLKIVTAFESEYRAQKRDYLIFNTEFFNLTDHELELRPSDFQALFSGTNSPNASEDNQPRTYVALDPDEALRQTDLQMRREEARLRANKVFNTVLFVALAAATVSNESHPQRYSEYASKGAALNLGFQTWAVKRVADRAAFASRMDRLQWERTNWQQETFRRTTLAPGASVRGRLLVPANREAAMVELSYPAPSGYIRFAFRQELTRGNR